MGNISLTLHAMGAHHNADNPHDLNKMFARFVDDVKAKGHTVTSAVIHHGGAEDLLSEVSPTRSGAFGTLALATAALAAVLLIPGFIGTAAAADLQPKAVPVKAADPVTTSPFFIGIDGGMGFMNQQANFLTLPGEFAGSGKLYPTGGLLGITAGVGNTWGSFYGEAFVRADYAFTRASGNSPTDSFSVKNSWDLQQGVFIGVPLGTLAGALPAPPAVLPSPSTWPIPVNVPASFSSAAFVIGPEAGIAERSIGVDVTSLADGTGSSVSRWIYGPFVGARVKYLVSQNVSLDLSYDHEFYRNSWTQSGGTALIGQFQAIDTNTVRAGLSYHF